MIKFVSVLEFLINHCNIYKMNDIYDIVNVYALYNGGSTLTQV